MGNTPGGAHHHGKKDGHGSGVYSPAYHANGQYFDFSARDMQEVMQVADDNEDLWMDSAMRPRSSTITQGTTLQPHALPVVFKLTGNSGAKNVSISGTFNNWKTKIPLVKSHGDFTTIIDLPEGEHEFKYYVDGVWRHDHNFTSRENNQGSKNNVITVKRADFEVFEALAMDMSMTERESNVKLTSNYMSGEYGQVIPSRPSMSASGPPTLPPHLLQVILNQDVSGQFEPTLLPEPNHVMLNHLYALSIKDGVMVLSATHRYRKKFVTSLFYKPIDS